MKDYNPSFSAEKTLERNSKTINLDELQLSKVGALYIEQPKSPIMDLIQLGTRSQES